MLGSPGSGKSFVSAWLALKMGAVHVRSDDLRLAMFGQDRQELHREARYRLPVIGAMEYMTRQTLAAGHSVVDDANYNKRDTRRKLAAMAATYNATPITVWVQAPLDVARERVIARAEQGGHAYFDIEFVERMAKKIQPPLDDELTIRLDGMQTKQEQEADFDRQFADIARRHVQ